MPFGLSAVILPVPPAVFGPAAGVSVACAEELASSAGEIPSIDSILRLFIFITSPSPGISLVLQRLLASP
jgi:hypothetical protein